MGIKERRLERMRKAIFRKPYVFIFIFIFLAYLGLNFWVNQLYVSFSTLTNLATWFWIPFVLFAFLIVPFLAALTINLSIIRFKEAGFRRREGGAASIGFFAGILGGACPGCLVGLFPAVLGLFGIAGTSLSVLPLQGLEIQFLSSALLIFAVFLLTSDVVCKIPAENRQSLKTRKGNE